MSVPTQIQIGVIQLANYLIKGAIGSRLVIQNHTFFGFLNSTKEIEQCLIEMEIETKNYLTELGEINGT
jgi:hypothetical protein